MRSAVLSGAPSLERRRAHQALADATDAAVEPDRRAWHRASAAVGPDEDVAKELEASATRAQERGGMSAAGTFLRKAGDLSADPRSRARRYLAAAMAAITAGSLDTAAELITLAERQPGLDHHQRSQVVLRRAFVVGNRGRTGDAAPLFATAARAFEPVDPSRAHWVHLLALWCYLDLGGNAPAGAVAEAAAAAGASPRSDPRGAAELLLDGFAARIIDSRGSAAPLFRQALAVLDQDRAQEAPPGVIEMATFAAIELWDDAAQDALSSRHLRSMRMLGALARLPHALSTRANAEMLAGRLAEAQALYDEVHEVIQATGNPGAVGPVPPGEVMTAALRGDERRTRDLADAAVAHATPLRAGLRLDTIAHSLGLLALGHGRPPEAVEHLRFALTAPHTFVATTALPDLAEAAMRAGEVDLAQCATDQLLTSTRASDTSLAPRHRGQDPSPSHRRRLRRQAVPLGGSSSAPDPRRTPPRACAAAVR
jgi:tetratricopeptide (TPR) repeat protein